MLRLPGGITPPHPLLLLLSLPLLLSILILRRPVLRPATSMLRPLLRPRPQKSFGFTELVATLRPYRGDHPVPFVILIVLVIVFLLLRFNDLTTRRSHPRLSAAIHAYPRQSAV